MPQKKLKRKAIIWESPAYAWDGKNAWRKKFLSRVTNGTYFFDDDPTLLVAHVRALSLTAEPVEGKNSWEANTHEFGKTYLTKKGVVGIDAPNIYIQSWLYAVIVNDRARSEIKFIPAPFIDYADNNYIVAVADGYRHLLNTQSVQITPSGIVVE